MTLSADLKNLVNTEVRRAMKDTLDAKGLSAPTKPKKSLLEVVKTTATKLIKEAFILMPQPFSLKTENMSSGVKESHDNLYKGYIETFNKVSSALQTADRKEVKSSASAYRALKIDETYNLNAIKLHELYFVNISDMKSEIRVDSLPYMKFARDFGTFEAWQEDFIAACYASRNGWGLTVYEPYRDVYMNITVDSNNANIPLGCVPVVVMDMFEHAYSKDYGTEKRDYLFKMMKELNWDVVEARMTVAERSELGIVYKLRLEPNDKPDELLTAAGAAQTVPVQPAAINNAITASPPQFLPATTAAAALPPKRF